MYMSIKLLQRILSIHFRNYILSLASTIAELQQLLLYYQVLTRLPAMSNNCSSSLLSPPTSSSGRLDLLTHSSPAAGGGITGSSPADDKLPTSIAMSALASPTTAAVDMYRELSDPAKLSSFLLHQQSDAASAMSRMCKDSTGAAALFSRGLPPSTASLQRHYHPLSSPSGKMTSTASAASFPFPGAAVAAGGLRMNGSVGRTLPAASHSPDDSTKSVTLSP